MPFGCKSPSIQLLHRQMLTSVGINVAVLVTVGVSTTVGVFVAALTGGGETGACSVVKTRIAPKIEKNTPMIQVGLPGFTVTFSIFRIPNPVKNRNTPEASISKPINSKGVFMLNCGIWHLFYFDSGLSIDLQ